MKSILGILILTSLWIAGFTTSFAKTGIYLAGGLGWAQQTGLPDSTQFDSEGATEQSEGPFAHRIALGYNKDLNETSAIGLELGYGSYGNTDYGIGSLDSKAFDLLAVGRFRMSSRFEMFGKAGVARETLDVPDSLSNTIRGDRTDYNPMVGAGLGYSLSESSQIHLDYNHIFGGDVVSNSNDSTTPSLSAVLLGLQHTFG